jgi:hypothetical protein
MYQVILDFTLDLLTIILGDVGSYLYFMEDD